MTHQRQGGEATLTWPIGRLGASVSWISMGCEVVKMMKQLRPWSDPSDSSQLLADNFRMYGAGEVRGTFRVAWARESTPNGTEFVVRIERLM
jgi:hypothetical protein